jgi:hypothetical protein
VGVAKSFHTVLSVLAELEDSLGEGELFAEDEVEPRFSEEWCRSDDL